MNAILMHAELALIFLLTLVAWAASGSALRLKYNKTDAKLRRHASRLIGWNIAVSVLAAAVAAVVLTLAMTSPPVFWMDRLLLHLPLLGFPAVLLWTHALPRLRTIRQVEKPDQGEAGPVRATILAAAEPALTVSYRLVLLGSITALYFCFRPPVPFQLNEVFIPLALLLAAAVTTWLTHAAAYRHASSVADPVIPRAPWLVRFFRRLGIVAMALGIAAIPYVLGSQASKLPADIDMSAMPMDHGDGPPVAHAAAGHDHGAHGTHSTAADAAAVAAVSVAKLTGPLNETPDRRVTLTAKQATVALASGKTVEAWTYNGQIPGPELRFREGELIEVTLVNEDIAGGATIHWHGLDVPNAEDGVAGATQNAVMPGEQHVYRFRAEQVGTFWYHSHQHSKEAVQKGLFGSLIVEPAHEGTGSSTPAETGVPDVKDITVITHRWDDTGLAIGDSDIVRRETVNPGTPIRVRLINTDDWVQQRYELHGAPFRVTAVDGASLGGADNELLTDTYLTLPTGGRYDIEFVMPEQPVYLSVGNNRKLGVILSPDGSDAMPAFAQARTEFDPLHYGTSAPLPWSLDEGFDRSFEIVLDNKLGFFNGQLNMLYTMNGEVFPDTPMLMVREGELVKTTIVNRGSVEHPMHLHGHHMLVLSKNGEAATGSPWWSDTLDVRPGDVYEVAFLANNPGLWMDHCHNLTHAAIGMTMHLMYEGVYSPYRAGTDSGNFPE